jgi:hypothetical protein
LLNKTLLCTRVGLVPEGSGNPFFWPYVFVWSSSFSEDHWHSLGLLRRNMSLLFGQANTFWHVMLLLFALSVHIMGCGCCFFIAVVCALSVSGRELHVFWGKFWHCNQMGGLINYGLDLKSW